MSYISWKKKMKTKQEVVEHFRERISHESEMEKNATAAGDAGMQSWHCGRKKAFKDVADYLVTWDIKPDEETETTLVG